MTTELQLVQNLTMGETDFKQFMRLSNQLVNAAENFAGEEKLIPVLIPTMSKDMVEQLKLAHKVVDILNRANRKTCVTVLRYNMDKPESCYAQVQFFARKNEDEKFQQVLYVNYKLEEFIYLLEVMISWYDKVITNQHNCNVFKKVIASVYHYHFFPLPVKMCWSIGGNRNLFLKLKSKLGLYHVVLTTPKTSP